MFGVNWRLLLTRLLLTQTTTAATLQCFPSQLLRFTVDWRMKAIVWNTLNHSPVIRAHAARAISGKWGRKLTFSLISHGLI